MATKQTYSEPIPGTGKPGRSPIYRNPSRAVKEYVTPEVSVAKFFFFFGSLFFCSFLFIYLFIYGRE